MWPAGSTWRGELHGGLRPRPAVAKLPLSALSSFYKGRKQTCKQLHALVQLYDIVPPAASRQPPKRRRPGLASRPRQPACAALGLLRFRRQGTACGAAVPAAAASKGWVRQADGSEIMQSRRQGRSGGWADGRARLVCQTAPAWLSTQGPGASHLAYHACQGTGAAIGPGPSGGLACPRLQRRRRLLAAPWRPAAAAAACCTCCLLLLLLAGACCRLLRLQCRCRSSAVCCRGLVQGGLPAAAKAATAPAAATAANAGCAAAAVAASRHLSPSGQLWTSKAANPQGVGSQQESAAGQARACCHPPGRRLSWRAARGQQSGGGCRRPALQPPGAALPCV